VHWIRLDVERDNGWILGNSGMKLWVPYIWQKKFPSSRNTMSHLVGDLVKCQRVTWFGEIYIIFWLPKPETDTTGTSQHIKESL